MKISKSFKVYIHTLLITFICSYSYADQQIIKNFSVHESPILIKNIKFKDFNLQDVDLNQNKGNIVVLNFWATWCAPCKKEMPSLSQLSRKLPNLKVYAINMEKPNIKKVENFYNELEINNIKIYFDPEFNLAKKFRMRGLPTTIFLDKSGNEFARAIGEIDFNSKKLIELLEKKINL